MWQTPHAQTVMIRPGSTDPLLYALCYGRSPSSGCGQLANNTLHGSNDLQRAGGVNQGNLLTQCNWQSASRQGNSLEGAAAHWLKGPVLARVPFRQAVGLAVCRFGRSEACGCAGDTQMPTCSGCTMVAASSS